MYATSCDWSIVGLTYVISKLKLAERLKEIQLSKQIIKANRTNLSCTVADALQGRVLRPYTSTKFLIVSSQRQHFTGLEGVVTVASARTHVQCIYISGFCFCVFYRTQVACFTSRNWIIDNLNPAKRRDCVVKSTETTWAFPALCCHRLCLQNENKPRSLLQSWYILTWQSTTGRAIKIYLRIAKMTETLYDQGRKIASKKTSYKGFLTSKV